MSEQVLKRLYSMREAARYLGVSPWSVRNLQKLRTLPCLRQGRRVLFDIHDLERHIENHKTEVRDGHDLSPQET